MNDGFVLLHRQIIDNELWDDKPYAKGQAWVDLIMKANFKEVRKTIKGNKVVIKRGQLLRSVENLADDWGWSPNKVRRFLGYLVKEQMAQVDGRPYGTLITIENYECFQDVRRANGRTNERADGRADGRGEKERKERKEIGAFEAPAAAAVFSFFEGHGYRSDPEAFLAYYEGTGWKKKNGQPITDWKSAAKAWERREKQFAIDRGAEPASGKSNVPKPPEPPKYKAFEKEPERDTVPMPDEVRRKLLKAVT